MNKYKITIIDVNGHLHVIHREAFKLQDIISEITKSKDFIDLGKNKQLNPQHIVTIKGDLADVKP